MPAESLKIESFIVTSTLGESLAARSYCKDSAQIPNCLVLHGAGTATQERVEPLCMRLAGAGYPCLSFDFSGHGESSGTLNTSSLKKKTMEALEMIEHLDPTAPVTICAFSMSGHIALRLLQFTGQRISNIVLFAPAVYDADAFEVSFGPDFTRIIRADASWRRSDAPRYLQQFTGRLLIVISKKDNVVPQDVVHFIESFATHASVKRIIYLPDAPHQLGAWMVASPINADILTSQIADFLSLKA